MTIHLSGYWTGDARGIEQKFDADVTCGAEHYVLIKLPFKGKAEVISSNDPNMFSLQAIDGFTKIIDSKKYNQSLMYYLRGVEKSKLNRSEDAVADYSNAILLKPDYTNAFYNRGYAKISLDLFSRAVADFDRTIALDPNHQLAYHNRGYAYYKLGEWQKAVNDYDKQIEINGASYVPYFQYKEDALNKLK